MYHYIGLDVSLKETFVCVVDEKGTLVHQGSVSSDVEAIEKYLLKLGFKENCKLGIESGQLSIHLCKGLSYKGYAVICVDARHMASALSARINKNDKNDAFGIANMLRAGLYKEVQIKSDENCELKVLLGARRQLVTNRQQLMGTVRGLLKIYGIKLGVQTNFESKTLCAIKHLSSGVQGSIKQLLDCIKSAERSLKELEQLIHLEAKVDEDCKLLMTVPGVGKITALTYKSSLDEYGRFKDSEAVGAYMGLTPRQYSSGEVNRHGSISKMGPKECRTMLYEAAQSLLIVNKKSCKLKSWGKKLLKKKGSKKAIVAVARKLAVIMHRMLIDRKEFSYA
jgi:transposase